MVKLLPSFRQNHYMVCIHLSLLSVCLSQSVSQSVSVYHTLSISISHSWSVFICLYCLYICLSLSVCIYLSLLSVCLSQSVTQSVSVYHTLSICHSHVRRPSFTSAAPPYTSTMSECLVKLSSVSYQNQ